jgi:hypothetical protein
MPGGRILEENLNEFKLEGRLKLLTKSPKELYKFNCSFSANICEEFKTPELVRVCNADAQNLRL